MSCNPYQDIDWLNTQRLTGCTHMHCLKQEQLDAFIADGLEVVSISNYYPSAPSYPLATWNRNSCIKDQFGYVKDGQWIKEHISFEKVIREQHGDIAGLPTEERVFKTIPASILEVPNAEHHSFSDAPPQLHLTAPGCLLSSGSFDGRNHWHLNDAGYSRGCGVPWRDAVKAMLSSMLEPEGGGVIINHPMLSGLNEKLITDMLDFDPGVLGIEIYNHSASKDFAGYADSLWDRILSTGRRCWGFCVTDQPEDEWWGRIVALTNERTPAAYLKALRQGAFYGNLTGSGLQFDSIRFDGSSLSATCNKEVYFQLMSRRGLTAEASGKEFSFTFNENQWGELGYLRLTASVNAIDKLYAQPMIL